MRPESTLRRTVHYPPLLFAMPHIHLITSASVVENVDIPDILRELVKELSRQETIDSKSIKAYHSLFQTWAMGEGAPAGFAHCTLGLITGRPSELRKTISDAMYSRLRDSFKASLDAGEVSLTFELREMDADTYRKGL